MTVPHHHELENLMQLCQIACTPEEASLLCGHVERVLTYMRQLEEVETAHVEPCFTVLEGVASVLRDDVVEETLSREAFLSNAPAHMGGMIKTPPVMK